MPKGQKLLIASYIKNLPMFFMSFPHLLWKTELKTTSLSKHAPVFLLIKVENVENSVKKYGKFNYPKVYNR